MVFRSTCGRCGGTGYFPKNVCKKCNGSGRIQVKRQIKVKIPKGMPEGGQLRVRGGGVPGLQGGKPGDLYIVVTTKKHPIFRRNPDYGDLRLEMDLYINPLIAACGGTVSIPTPYEMKTQYLAPGTENGQKIVLDDSGIRQDGKNGPLIVNLIYDTLNPSMFSEKDKEILKTASEIISKNPDYLVNSRQQTKDLNSKTKLPWIVSIEK